MKKKPSKKKVSQGSTPATKRKRTSQKVLSAAGYIKQKTKKMIDDVFLTIVGTKALVRAQEITRGLKTEKANTKARQ